MLKKPEIGKMKEEFTLTLDKPHPMAYIQIRKEVGFGEVTLQQSQDSLSNSLFCVSLYQAEKLVGFGRIVGDGVLYFYVSDVLVSPEMKGKGLGNKIMEELLSYLKRSATPLSTIALLSAPNREGFYQKHGFEICPNKYFGKGLSYTKLVQLES